LAFAGSNNYNYHLVRNHPDHPAKGKKNHIIPDPSRINQLNYKMVNIFSRFTRRATSSGSAADASTKTPKVSHGDTDTLNRTLSASSAKRLRRSPADEPKPRRLLLISDTADFDPYITHRFQAEGFEVTFIGFVGSGDSERDRKALEHAVTEKEDELEEGERYAIVGMCFLQARVVYHEYKTDRLIRNKQHTTGRHTTSSARTT
jgi:hypothetical protein